MATDDWLNAVSDNWTTPGDWSSGQAPNSGDTARIAVPGNYTIALTTPITVAAVTISATSADLAIDAPGQTEHVTGDFGNAGTLGVDRNDTGGSTLAVGGTLSNTGAVAIGSGSGFGGLQAPAAVTAAALVDSGTIAIDGGAAELASLVIAAAAGFGTVGVLTGLVELSGDALLQFAGGTITTIANGSALTINGVDAFVADSGATGANSALTGLTTVAGSLALLSGATVVPTGDLAISGSLGVDGNGGYAGGSSLLVGGTLTVTGTLTIGSGTGFGGLQAPATVTASALSSTGTIDLAGGATEQAKLAIAAAAGFGTTGVLTGQVAVTGDALLQFGGGELTTIASGSALSLEGTDAFVADAGAPASNSALTGLAMVAGSLSLSGGERIAPTGDLTVSGTVSVDRSGFTGNSLLAVAGTLTEIGTLNIGSGNGYGALGGPAGVTASGLFGSGTINLDGSSTNLASLVIVGPAGFGTAGVLTGQVELSNDALLQFGSGQIATIASGSSLSLTGNNAFVADANDPSSNSALTGLGTIAGTLSLADGAVVAPTGDLSVTGTVKIDRAGFSSGASLAVGGTLTETGTLNVGSGNGYGALGGPAGVTASGLVGSGTITLDGSSTNLASLVIAGPAGFGTAGVLTGQVELSNDALLQFGSGQIATIASGSSLSLTGNNAFVADASDPSSNSALTGLGTIAGTLSLADGAVVAPTGDLSVTGTVNIDRAGFSSGASLAVGGTLTETGTLNVGSGNGYGALAGPARITAGTLVGSGTIALDGSSTNLASLVIAGPAGFGTAGVLTGQVELSNDALLQFGSGQIATIASGSSLSLTGNNAFVADASDPSSNSALTGLGTIAGTLSLADGAVVAPTGDLSVTGTVNIDRAGFSSGARLAVLGTLTETGTLNVGSGNGYGALAGPARITAGTLVGSGTIALDGSSTNLASLVIAGPAGFGTAGVLTGQVELSNDALLQFGSGQIATIASGSSLSLTGNNAFVADASDPSSNSALTGLGTIAGTLSLADGAVVAPTGDLSVTGTVNIDRAGFSSGARLAVLGTLTETGTLNVGSGNGYGALAGPARITAATLVGSGTIALDGSSTNLASLVIAGPAGFGTAGVLTGQVELSNDALLQFGSGQIATIASGSSLSLTGNNAFVADAGDPSSNSALTGLGTIAGTLSLADGAVVAPTGALSVTGTVDVDRNGGTGLSRLAVGGLLTNSGILAVGSGNGFAGLSAPATISADGLANSGSISLDGSAAATATLAVTGATTNTNSVSIDAFGALTSSTRYTQAAGVTTVVGTLTAPTVAVSGGTLEGSGTIDGTVVLSGGAIAGYAASAPATLTITGGFSESATGGLSEVVNGTGAGQASDIAVAGGAVSLNGTLQVQTGTGFTFALGQTFTVMTFAPGSLTGTFGTISYAGHGGSAEGVNIGNGLALQAVYDNAGGDVQLDVVQAFPAPTINAPAKLPVFAGVATLVSGLGITDPAAGTGALTVTLTAHAGTLSGAMAGTGTADGVGTGALTLTGDLADLNAELASVAYTAASSGSDTIHVAVTDAHGAAASQDIDVATFAVPQTIPVLNAPLSALIVAGQPSGIPSLSLSDPYAQFTGQQLTLTVSPLLIHETYTTSGTPGATVTGQGSDGLTITGTVDQINAYIGDGIVTELLKEARDQAAGIAAEQEAKYVQQVESPGYIGVKTALDFALAVEGSNGAIVDLFKDTIGAAIVSVDSFNYSYAAYILNGIAAIAVGQPPPPPGGGGGGGGAHFVTFDGLSYQLDAAGEFVLAASAQDGDSFLVEVRLQPVAGSASASAITEIAALIGADSVTFAAGRANPVWVDGAPSTLGPANPLALSGGKLTELTANSYQLSWNTGEVLTITDEGTYLDYKVQLGPKAQPGSVQGLLGTDSGAANTFTLPDGTVLPQPLTSAQLAQFAQSWLVPPGTSLFDYAAGESPATFDDPTFPTAPLTLADFPAAVLAQAAQAVAAAGITDPGAVQAAEYDYIVSGGQNAVLSSDANIYAGLTTTVATVTPSGTPSVAVGVLADRRVVAASASGPTAVTFDLFLTHASAMATTIDYAVVAPFADDFNEADLGGQFPLGQVTIAAGATTAQVTIAVPAGALGGAAEKTLEVEITSPDGTPLYATTAGATVVAPPQPGPPPVPVLTSLTNVGTLTHVGNAYTLDLGQVGLGEPLPLLQFGIANAAAAPADALGGTFDAANVTGFTVAGAALPASIAAGESYTGLSLQVNDGADGTAVKFGANTETVTFTPQDLNASGYAAAMAPITLTVNYALLPSNVVYSQAWGDVHIITYNQLHYDFQGVGEFTLAHSNDPGDSFDIQLRLAPWYNGAPVTTIQQVAVSLGADDVTFDWSRPDPVYLDHAPDTAISLTNPTLTLAGGTITELTASEYKVTWTTGEAAWITNVGSFINVEDETPVGLLGFVSGLQGEDQGSDNDFQLPDGTVLQQPLSTSNLYGTYANGWRVTPATSLFDYAAGQSTATFTDPSFPAATIRLATLPAALVHQAAAVVAAAGITDPVTATNAELDYIVTGENPDFIAGAQNVAQLGVGTVAADVTDSQPSVPSLGVYAPNAEVVEAVSGATIVTFDVFLTAAAATATTVAYSVEAPDATYLGASAFGGTLPAGMITIAAGQTSGQITVVLPHAALGAISNANLEIGISTPGATPVIIPTAQTEIVNDQPVPGAAAVPQLVYRGTAGTFTFDAADNTYMLDLGTAIEGALLTPAQFAVANAAVGTADRLGGTFVAPTGGGFIVTGDVLATPLAPGATYQGLNFAPATNALGAFTETLVFHPTDVNDSGYSASLAPLTLIIADTVTAPAQARLNTPGTIIFQNVRVGTADTQGVSISNTAGSGAAALDVTPTAAQSAITSGAIVRLAAGATDYADLSVGLDTTQAGERGGLVSLSAQSDAGGGNTLPLLPDFVIDVFGSVYRTAAATITATSAIVHVGDAATSTITVRNGAAADGFSENLVATLIGVSGGLTLLNAGTTAQLAAGASDSTTDTIGFSTAQAGIVSGTADFTLLSDGGTGQNSIDGLGQIALAPVAAPLTITVDNYAAAALVETSGPGTLTRSGTAYTLDLGSVAAGTVLAGIDLAALNSATGPADLLSGTVQVTGSSAFTNALSGVSDLVAGQSASIGIVTFDTSRAGTFSETITFDPVGSNASGYSASLASGPETLTILGAVASVAPVVTISAVEGNDVVTAAQAQAAGGVPLSGTVTGLAAGATFTVGVSDGSVVRTYTATVGTGGTSWTATIPSADAIAFPDGIATVSAQASDANGNRSALVSRFVTIDETRPVVTISAVEGNDVVTAAQAQAAGGVPLSGTVTGLAAGATFTVGVSDGSVVRTYTATVGTGGTSWTATIPSADAIAFPDGIATVSAQASDANGNQSALVSRFVTIDETRPVVTISAVEGNDLITAAQAQAAGGVPLSGTVTGLAAGATFLVHVSDGSFSNAYTALVGTNATTWTATMPMVDAEILPAGTAQISAQVTDANGNPSALVARSVTIGADLASASIAAINGNDVIDSSYIYRLPQGPYQIVPSYDTIAGGNVQAIALSGVVTGIPDGDTFEIAISDGAITERYTPVVDPNGGRWTFTMPASDVGQLRNGTATVSADLVAASSMPVPIGSARGVTVRGSAATATSALVVSLNATLEIAGPAANAVSFASSNGGVLVLDQSSAFAGTISGFAGQDRFDLSDMLFASHPTIGYAPNAGGTGGTLTITDGAQAAQLIMLGHYLAASFSVSSDAHGGTFVSDPPVVANAMILAPQTSHG